jgi:hypothetical protein
VSEHTKTIAVAICGVTVFAAYIARNRLPVGFARGLCDGTALGMTLALVAFAGMP